MLKYVIWNRWTAHNIYVCCSFSSKTPGGEPCVMTAGCLSSHLGSTSSYLPPLAVAHLSRGSFSTSTQASSMCLSLSIMSSKPSLTPAHVCVATWTAGPCLEHTGTSSLICTPATFTSWRITSVQSRRTMSQALFFAEAPVTPSVPLLCVWTEGMPQPLIHLMKPGVLRNVGL